MQVNELYKPWYVDNDKLKDERMWGFEIVAGDYKNVIVQIENIDLPNDSNDLVVDYHIISKPDDLLEQATKDEMFFKLLEAIINDIVKNAIEGIETAESDNSEQNRVIDTKEPSSQ